MDSIAGQSAPKGVLGPTEALYPGMRRTVLVGRTSVIVHVEDDGIFAIENSCPHYQVPLDQGKRKGSYIECPWHRWLVDVRTGECLHNPRVTARRFEVAEENGNIIILGDHRLDGPIPSPVR
jgi:nitrite reductase/ring-hydroxylating ferredoxin subunit